MCLYTPPCLYTPLYICTPPVHLYAPICLYIPPYVHMLPQGCTHPPGAPMFLCSCMVLAHCMLWVFFFYFMCIGTHHPYLGVSPLYYTPHTLLLVLCALLFSGISVLMWAFSPSIEGFGGVPPITGGGWGDTSVAVHMLILLHLFCSAFMSCVSTTAPTTTPPITVVSSGLSSVSSVSVAPSLTGFPVSHGVVPPPPLMPRSSGGVFGSVFYAAAADSIFNASSGLCQLCYGFSTGRFFLFFRVEPPTICILYMFGVCCGVCFLF